MRNFGISLPKLSVSFVAGSLLLLSAAQAGQAEASGGRGSDFRDFRQANPGIERSTLRRMFNAERNGNSATRFDICPMPAIPSVPVPGKPEIPNIPNPKQSVQLSSLGNLIRIKTGIDLDLNSQNRNITLGNNLFADTASVVINVGGASKTLTAGSQVSAAEYVAVKQVLGGSQQKISIDAGGNAIGGEVDLSSITANNDKLRAANLVVAQNVTTYGDFGKRADFKLMGNLDNFGTVHAFSTDSNVRSGTISADDINNRAGALIHSDVDLHLDALGSLSNQGVISASGDLSITTGGALNNGGTIKSNNADVTFNAPEVLNVNNAGGVVSALSGAINLRAADYNGSFDSTISGGDLLSRDFNINAGQALATVNVNKLTGTINQTGAAAHVAASTENLALGEICLTGDPTFYNTAGSISITGNIAVAERLVIIASGDINDTGGSNVVVSAGDTAQGYDITLIAGADFTVSGGSNSPTLPAPGNQGAVTLSGKASKSGGSVILVNNTTLSSGPTDLVDDDNAGAISIFAFAGKGENSGVINTGGAELFTGGSGSGNNGNIILVAGGKAPETVRIGRVVTTGGTGGAGTLQATTAQPVSTDKKFPIVYDATGVQFGSSLVGSDKLTKDAGIKTVDTTDTITSGNVLLAAGGEITIQSNVVAGGQVLLSAGADIGGGTTPIIAAAVLARADGNIGGAIDPLRINTDNLSFEAGGFANFELYGTGDLNITSSAVADSTLQVIDAVGVGNDRSVDMLTPVSASSVIIRTFDILSYSFEDVGDSIEMSTTNAAGAPLEGDMSYLDFLILDIAAGVGTSGNPFVIDKVSLVQASGAEVYLTNAGKKASTFEVNADTFARLGNISSLTVQNTTINNGSLEILSVGKSLTFSGVTSAENNIDVTQQSGKITFNTASSLFTFAPTKTTTEGDITITLGGTGTPADNQGPFDNVNIQEVGGNVIINGPGFKAKEPTNLLRAEGADLVINNSLKAGSFILNGDVLIEADPPVPEGTPVNFIPATTPSRGARTPIMVTSSAPSAVSDQPTFRTAQNTPEFLVVTEALANLISKNSIQVQQASMSIAPSDDSLLMPSISRQKSSVWVIE